MTRPRLQLVPTVHDIDVLQAECARFIQEEPDHQGGSQVGAKEDETKAIRNSVIGKRRQKSNHDCSG